MIVAATIYETKHNCMFGNRFFDMSKVGNELRTAIMRALQDPTRSSWVHEECLLGDKGEVELPCVVDCSVTLEEKPMLGRIFH